MLRRHCLPGGATNRGNHPRSPRGGAERGAGARHRLHADWHLPRADPAPSRRGARLVPRRDVQPGRVHVNVDPRNVHIPRGDVPRSEVEAHCREYELAIQEAGGIDFQILGIGQTGHVGFNEPGSSAGSVTRLVVLDTITRRTAAADFFGTENVPTEAITMGVATILAAREIALIATGEHKAVIVKRAVEGEVDRAVAATYLQQHPNATVFLDPAAAAELTRRKTPWLLGEIEWTSAFEIEAVVWLSQVTHKSVLKLDDVDYREHHLSALLTRHGSSGTLNGIVFNSLIAKIRGRSKLPREKRIVVFSPHPDDDVISAGGVLRKLRDNDNHILIAYQTSGNIAVFDHEVRRYLDFPRRTADDFDYGNARLRPLRYEVEQFLERKQPGDLDSEPVLMLKRRIREVEAVSAIQTLRMRPQQARFLNMPFYQTGKVRKDPIGARDVEIILELPEEQRPQIILVAGDLSDPHGTHQMCKDAIERALERYTGEAPEVWFYRGAWQEWSVADADILVPMSEEELRLKIMERVEERNKATAQVVDQLGLPEYFAMEALVARHPAERGTAASTGI
ncbi:MAG: glucosamine-6-phosphate deaminase [Candidatus Eisenbacteria bacterium]|uniref:Glucosamine-6-phosphate deaminase n=1 Tax=Eiseniibacteriota bacterium TaxID=2212470 RepID=A0A538U1T5_UNCEI|nr:MAG: glucosamine-6-phosphate deaminase [Candidatus Eisenbacteria bacterium]